MGIDRKEQLSPTRIAFFDADKTLWRVIPTDPNQDDWASKGATRTFILEAPGKVVRVEDGTRFILKEGVEETLQKLAKEGVIAGIISDNENEDVEKVSELLGIWHHFDRGFTNVRLWKGPADKGLMISELMKTKIMTVSPKTLLVDDSARYGEQMAEAGCVFILSPKDTFPKASILGFFGFS